MKTVSAIHQTVQPTGQCAANKRTGWAAKAANVFTAVLAISAQFQGAAARALSQAPKNGTSLPAPVTALAKAAPKVPAVPNIDVTGLPGPLPRGDFLPSYMYLDGPLIKSPAVTTLAWGGGKNDESVRNFPVANSFLYDLPKTKYMAWVNKEYSVPKYPLKGGRFVRELVIYPTYKATIDDKKIQATIKQLVKQKVLPKNLFGNSLTMVFLPPGVSAKTKNGGRSCIDLCAYTSAFRLNGKYQFYAVIPDQECAGIKNAVDCQKDLSLVDATTTAISYAYVAAKTNPAQALDGEVSETGWFSFRSGDLGIPCTGRTDRIVGPTGVTWTVQQVWSNKDRTCRTEPGRPSLVKGLY